MSKFRELRNCIFESCPEGDWLEAESGSNSPYFFAWYLWWVNWGSCPNFCDFYYLIAAGQAPNLANWLEVQTQNLSIMLLDLVPVLFGIIAAKLSIELQKFKAKLQEDRQARTELGEQLDRWEAIFDHTPVGYAVMDRELNIVYANKICGELADATIDQLLGQKCFDYFGAGEVCKECPVARAGSDSLASVPRLEQVTKIIRHHHEAFAGNGYPDGLSELAIPIGSRVICAADAFDAMTSDRVYRKAMGKEKAMEQLALGAGKQFDPRVVEAFLEVIGENKVIQFPLAREKLS
ncbi:MAG: HD-GYP domain-containing protein [Carboxydocellales bacterium]